jgi:CRISPR-associated Csx2 family protein
MNNAGQKDNHSYTLVSCVGTGMYKEEGGYRETKYHFPSGEEYTTRFFIQALFEKHYRPVHKIILVGTVTSLWDAFIDEKDSRNTDLWVSIRQECENKQKGISAASIGKLESYIAGQYGVPCRILAHTQTVDADTAGELFSVYNGIAAEILPHTDVLFDITHGFRSMPLLLYQSLQFSSSGSMMRRVELVYGEYIDQEKISYVRDLSSYWNYSEITFARSRFENQFDGMLLSEKVKPLWPAGSTCIARFSMIVACNYALQIDEVCRQIQAATSDTLSRFPEKHWVHDIRHFLLHILRSITGNTKGERLLAYAKLLEEHRLTVQAVITLQTAIETAVTEKFGNDSYIGNYEWWQEHGKDEYYRLREECTPDDQRALSEIEYIRNTAAQAGARDRNTKLYPSAESISAVLEKGKNAVDGLFKVLKNV